MILRTLIFILSVVLLAACSKKPELRFSGDLKEKSIASKAVVSNVTIEDDQLKVQGLGLDHIKKVTIKNADGFNESFDIESKSNSQLIANGLKNFSFLIGKAFTLILADAYGAATFDITFTLQDGAVTASKLSDMGASDGDVLIYNQTLSTWEPRALSGLNLIGTWNADTNDQDLADGGYGAASAPNSGDYYVVSVSGPTLVDGINTWNDGDWAIFNGVAWDRIVNSAEITSFNTRTGAVTPQEGDYDLDELGDVDLSVAPLAGQVLKYDGTKWIAQDDEVSTGGGSGTGETANVILNADSDGDSNGEIQFKVNSDTKAVIDNNGNLALGSSTASAKLDVFATTTNPIAVFDMADNTASNFVLKQSSDEYINVDTTDSSEKITFGNITTNPNFVFMGGNVGIGTTNPVSELDVFSSASTAPRGIVSRQASSDGNAASISGYKSRGSGGTPTAISNGDSIFTLNGFGYDGSDFERTGFVKISAAENFSAGSHGSNIKFNTTPIGESFNDANVRMTITNAGNVGIGTATPAASLEVVQIKTTGTISTSGSSVTGDSTNFTQSLKVGDKVNIKGYVRTVTNIADDLNMTLDSNPGSNKPVGTHYSRLGASFRSGNVGFGTTNARGRVTVGDAIISNTPLTHNDVSFLLSRGNDFGGLALLDRDQNLGTDHDTDTVIFYGDDEWDNFHIAFWENSAASLRKDLTIDGTNGNVGVGTTAPTAKLNIVDVNTSSNRGIQYEYYGNNNFAASTKMRKSRGTPSAPLVVVDGDYSGSMNIGNYDGTAFLTNAGITGFVNGTVATGSVPTDLYFWTSATDETNPVQNNKTRMAIKSNGNVGIGTTAPNGKFEITNLAGAGDKSLIVTSNSQNSAIFEGRNNATSFLNTQGPYIINNAANAGRRSGLFLGLKDIDKTALISAQTTNSIGGHGKLQFGTKGSDGLIERMTITEDGNVGIGTTAPGQKFVVGSDIGGAGFTNPEGRVAVGSTSGKTGYDLGEDFNHRAGLLWDTTENNLYMFTREAGVTYDKTLVLKSGNVGIGDPSSINDALDVVGDVDATGCFQNNDSGTIGGTCVSDERLKENINPLSNMLDKVLGLRPVEYVWKHDYQDIHKKEGQEIGFIAQEVEEVFPELVETKEDGYKRVKYDVSLTVRIVQAIKEFFGIYQEDKQKLERDIASLKQKNERLEAENRAIKAYLCSKDPDSGMCY